MKETETGNGYNQVLVGNELLCFTDEPKGRERDMPMLKVTQLEVGRSG